MPWCKSKTWFLSIGIAWLYITPHVSAQAQINSPAAQAALMDFETREILFCKVCDEQMSPSSMTKLMTVELVFQRLKDGRFSLADTLPVSERAWRRGLTNNESKMWVELGSQISVDNLLKGIIVSSGGDACIVVAEAFGGTEEAFAEMMSNRARELGLSNSHYMNSHGLSEQDHYMSARDIATLSAHLMREYPEYYHYFSIPEFTWSGIRQGNRNQLIFRNGGVDGLKTGHTDAGGYGIVVSAERDGRRLISSVNGLASEAERNAEAVRLLDIGYREFRPYELFTVNEIVAELNVWGGAQDVVPAIVLQPLQTILSPHTRAQMQVTVSYDGPLEAPIQAGQEIGMLTISAPSKPDVSVPLIASKDVAPAGIFKNMYLGLSALVGDSGQ